MRFKNFLIETTNSIVLDGDFVKVKGKNVGILKKKDGKYIFTPKTDHKNPVSFDSMGDMYQHIINTFKVKIGNVDANSN